MEASKNSAKQGKSIIPACRWFLSNGLYGSLNNTDSPIRTQNLKLEPTQMLIISIPIPKILHLLSTIIQQQTEPMISVTVKSTVN